MADLTMRVFEHFALKDVFGEMPPLSEIKQTLESDFQSAVSGLEQKDGQALQKTLEAQLAIKRELDVRSGSMALSHEKIEAFTEYLARYVSEIRGRLEKIQ